MSIEIAPGVPGEMMRGGAAAWSSRGARLTMWIILGVHAALLVASLPDYRVSIDSGYHVSLARWYGEHGTAWWDAINFGPGGRPNLQGPALHVAIGVLGRLFGGSGDAYVLANAVLAVLQWVAALLTVVFFARRYGGDWGALFAGALLAGNALAAGSFAIGIPSGWIFVLAPWAIHFFLEERLALAALATSLAIDCHLAGYATVPAGILVAALLARRWRGLLIVGAATALLTAPYTVHLLRYRDWYRGEHGHVAIMLAPLIYVAAVPGLVSVLRRPRQNVFLLAWFAAPVAWLFQDVTRFLAQATLSMAVLGGVWAAQALLWMKMKSSGRTGRAGRWLPAACAVGLVALTILPSPLNLSSLVVEAAWLAGIHYPRPLDWREARVIAGVIERAGLDHRLIAAYNPSECIRFAVYAPLTFEKGHWVEVQPRHDPAGDLSAGVKVYVVPLAPTDPTLVDLQRRGLVAVHGGSAIDSVVTLVPRRAESPGGAAAGASPPAQAGAITTWPAQAGAIATTPAAAGAKGEVAEDVGLVVAGIMRREAAWLAANARNNVLAPVGVILSPAALAAWHRTLLDQRTHAGRLEVVTAVYAFALEGSAPAAARGFRGAVRGFGSLANFLGDDEAIGFVDDAHHERMRRNMASVAAAADGLSQGPIGAGPLGEALTRLFDEYFTAA